MSAIKTDLENFRNNWKTRHLKISKRPEADTNQDGSLKSKEVLMQNIDLRLKDLSTILELCFKIYRNNKDLYGDRFLAYIGNEVIREFPWKDFPLLSEKSSKTCEKDIMGKQHFEVEKHIKDTLHYEHHTPISFFRDLFDSFDSLTAEDFYYVLKEYYKIVWITKEENQKLEKAGFKTTRPLDAYSLVEIFCVSKI